MTPPLEPPVRPSVPRPPRAWTDFDRLSRERENDPRIVGAAALLTLLLHAALFFWVIPWVGMAMQTSRIPVAVVVHTAPPVEYTLAPATPADLQALRFVETNPNAPATPPPMATNNVSNRDQRVAQPNPNPDGHSDTPQTDGQMQNTQKIVQGDLSKPTPPPTPPAPKAPAEQKPAVASQPSAPPQASAPAAVPAKPTASDGEGIRLAEKPPEKPAEQPTNSLLPPTVTQAQPTVRPGPLTPDVVAQTAAAATPQTRESLNVKALPGPVVMEKQGTHNAGVNVAVDAKFSQFGAYMEMLLEAISRQWDDECENYSFSPRDAGTAVEVEFVINKKGEVTNLQVVQTTAGRGPTLMCVNAIKLPAPYEAWSKEMIAIMGEENTVGITFYYQ